MAQEALNRSTEGISTDVRSPMRKWASLHHLRCACLLVALSGTTLEACSNRPPQVPRNDELASVGEVDSVSLVDVSDRREKRFRQLLGPNGTVIVFHGNVCPVAARYGPRLIALETELRSKGVHLLVVNANHNESISDVAEHAKTNHLTFPMYKDPSGRLADLLGATVQSEAVLLDHKLRVVYQGRIDDQFTVARKLDKPSHEELRHAVDALVAGRPIAIQKTAASGCSISRRQRATTAGDDAEVTYERDLAPVIRRNCMPCHERGSVAPMSLTTFDDVAAWAETLKEVVNAGRMPPWERSGPDRRYGPSLEGMSTLTPHEKQLFSKWVDLGTPRGRAEAMASASVPAKPGSEKASPEAAEDGDRWVYGTPDLIVQMPKPFRVPATEPSGGIPWQVFVVDAGVQEERFIESIEVKPGVRSVVHHSTYAILEPDGSRSPLFAFNPGRFGARYRAGLGRRLKPGSRIGWSIHYTADGVERLDNTRIGLRFTREKPRRELLTSLMTSVKLRIPAGAENHEERVSFTLPADAFIYGLGPHMHVRGKDVRVDAYSPDGAAKPLLFVPSYDFDWQHEYNFKEPIRLEKGTRIETVVHYDNSAKNARNPDSTATVTWGEQSWEEMFNNWLELAYDIDIDSPERLVIRQAQRQERQRQSGLDVAREHMLIPPEILKKASRSLDID